MSPAHRTRFSSPGSLLPSSVRFALFSILSISATFATLLSQENVSGTLKVYFLNVGQADAILVRCPTEEHFLLIDAADTRYPGSSKMFKAAMRELLPENDTIDVVVATHPHADHIGSMRWILENYVVLKYLDNRQPNETATYERLMDIVYEKVEEASFNTWPLRWLILNSQISALRRTLTLQS